ncbi:MAG: metal ABC transporter permease [Thermoleophilia bacterium]|nr:metal ABC transporter permease [Thermoleophilia bacterium]
MIEELFSDYTLRTVALGAALLGVVSGSLGTYAVLRRQALLGDAISHAALPGIALAFLLTASKAPVVLTLGAALAGWAGTLLVMAVVRTTRVKSDSALAIVLSVFFGVGLVLLTHLQRSADASQAGLDRYLFGQAAALLERDLVTIGLFGGVALGVALACWKEFKLLSFDPDFAATIGLRVRAYDVLLTGLLVLAVVVGLQTVGVVLMSAMVVAPAAAARQWTDRLGVMMALAALFGVVAGVGGAVVSSSAERMPTGPTIVLWLTGLVVVSLLAAPRRGLVWRFAADRRRAGRLRLGAALADLDALAVRHGSLEHGHSVSVLELTAGRGVGRSLAALEERGWAQRTAEDEWAITEAGRDEARRRRGG